MSRFQRPWVLDTNALTHLTKPNHPRHPQARQTMERLVRLLERDGWMGEVFLLPTIALFESKRGLLKKKASRQLREVERFIRAYAELIDFDEVTADAAARLWAQPGPLHNDDNDLMILASAVAEGADLVTEDAKLKKVSRPPEVRLWTWDELDAAAAAEE